MRNRATGLLLAAGAMLLVPGAAVAADIPGSGNTQATLKTGLAGVRGVFEQRADSDWYRVQLKDGQNYAIHAGLANDGCTRVNLRNHKGGVLGTARSDGGEDDGFEFQPGATRTFFVEFKDETGCNPRTSYPDTYWGDVAADARGDTKTAATLAVGQTIDGHSNWGSDNDFYRTRLVRGRTYAVTGDSRLEGRVRVVNAKGKVLREKFYTTDIALTDIKVPATGTYYVVINGLDDTGGSYKISLTQQ